MCKKQYASKTRILVWLRRYYLDTDTEQPIRLKYVTSNSVMCSRSRNFKGNSYGDEKGTRAMEFNQNEIAINKSLKALSSKVKNEIRADIFVRN